MENQRIHDAAEFLQAAWEQLEDAHLAIVGAALTKAPIADERLIAAEEYATDYVRSVMRLHRAVKAARGDPGTG